MKKHIASILVLVLIASILLPSSALAFNSQNSIPIQDTILNNNETITTSAVGGVLVFVGGILAGYIVDGVLIRLSGHSGGEWVAIALGYHEANPNETIISIPGSGAGGGGAGGFAI